MKLRSQETFGAILRTAEAMGVDAVLLSDSSVDFFNPNTIRSSMGLLQVCLFLLLQRKKSMNLLSEPALR